jgi:hypothetical protein
MLTHHGQLNGDWITTRKSDAPQVGINPEKNCLDSIVPARLYDCSGLSIE